MNKKGFEYIDDIGMFLLVSILFSAVIVLVVWIFFSVGGDVRMEEAKTLSSKLINAVAENNYLKEEILNEDYDTEDLMNDVLIDEKIVHSGGDFYFSVIVQSDEIKKEFSGGKLGFAVSCELPGKSKNHPICYNDEFSVYDRDGRKFVIKVLTGSKNLGGEL